MRRRIMQLLAALTVVSCAAIFPRTADACVEGYLNPWIDEQQEVVVSEGAISMNPGACYWGEYWYTGDLQLTVHLYGAQSGYDSIYDSGYLSAYAFSASLPISSSGYGTYTTVFDGYAKQVSEFSEDWDPYLGWDWIEMPVPPIPTGETTVLFNWQGGGAVSQWWQNLLPSTVSFAGRTVKEFTGAGAVDGCFDAIPNNASLRPEFVTLLGSDWPVEGSENLWGPDSISWEQASIDYYRAQGVTPCSATIPQIMRINVLGQGYVDYLIHNLIFEIGTTTVTYRRGNELPRSKPWPCTPGQC